MTPFCGVGSLPAQIVQTGVQSDVTADGQIGLLDRREEPVVALVVVVGQPELGGKDRKLERLSSASAIRSHLGHGEIDVVDRYLVRHAQTVTIRRGKLIECVVEGSE